MVQRRVHSEATVWSNFFDVVEVDPKWRSVPYGNPIWNHQHLSSMGVETVRMLAQVAIGNWNSRNKLWPCAEVLCLGREWPFGDCSFARHGWAAVHRRRRWAWYGGLGTLPWVSWVLFRGF